MASASEASCEATDFQLALSLSRDINANPRHRPVTRSQSQAPVTTPLTTPAPASKEARRVSSKASRSRHLPPTPESIASPPAISSENSVSAENLPQNVDRIPPFSLNIAEVAKVEVGVPQ